MSNVYLNDFKLHSQRTLYKRGDEGHYIKACNLPRCFRRPLFRGRIDLAIEYYYSQGHQRTRH